MWWIILDIEYTTDLNIIKEAYLRLIKEHHYEDDPEEYARITKAYKQGARNARRFTFQEGQDTVSEEKKIVIDFENLEEGIDRQVFLESLNHEKMQQQRHINFNNDAYITHLMETLSRGHRVDEKRWIAIFEYVLYHLHIKQDHYLRLLLSFLTPELLNKLTYKIRLTVIRKYLDLDIIQLIDYYDLSDDLIDLTGACIVRVDQSIKDTEHSLFKRLNNFMWNVSVSRRSDVYSIKTETRIFLKTLVGLLKYFFIFFGGVILCYFIELRKHS